MSDSYVYPGTTVLKNRLGIRDQYELDEAEHDLSAIGADVIADGYGPEKTFDRAHLKGLHRELFKEVYEWAGSMRDESPVVHGEKLDKVEMLSKGASSFIPGSMIARGIAVATSHIADREALREGTREEFAEKAGNALGELNHVHPFREGNGRTQRAFMEDLGRETGHDVDFRGITSTRMREASIAVNNDPHVDDMRHVMRDATDPERITALRELREKLDKSGYESDKHRIATSRDGEQIDGEIIHKDERVAHIVSGKNIIVANARDVDGREDADRQVSFAASPFDPSREIEKPSNEDREISASAPRVSERMSGMSNAETLPRPEPSRVLTIDQEIEARELAQRTDEAKAQDPAQYDKILAEAVRGNGDVANGAFQLVDEDTAEDMLRHVEKKREEQPRTMEPDETMNAQTQPTETTDLVKDREDVLDDRAEDLQRKSVQAMRDGLSEIDDPAKLVMARKLIDRMEETGRQFRQGRAADDRDSSDLRDNEAVKARDADAERQTREAATRAASRTASDRDAVERHVAADATNRDRIARDEARLEREIDRDDDVDR